MGPVNSSAHAVAIQNDGKIVAGGFSFINQRQDVFTLIRYNADGTLDPAFGNAGIVTTTINNSDAAINSLVLQANGDIVAGGFAFDSHGNEGYDIARYLPNGQLDSTFGSNGQTLITNFGTTGLTPDFGAMTLQSDGKIVVVGDQSSGGYGQGIELVRLRTT